VADPNLASAGGFGDFGASPSHVTQGNPHMAPEDWDEFEEYEESKNIAGPEGM
jgi:hypothetical protein